MIDTASLKEAIDAYDAGKKYTLTELGSLLESILVPAARLVLAARSAESAVEAAAKALEPKLSFGPGFTKHLIAEELARAALTAASLSGTVERGVTEGMIEAGAQALCQYAGDDWTDEPTRDDYRADVGIVLRAASLSGAVEHGAVTEEMLTAAKQAYDFHAHGGINQTDRLSMRKALEAALSSRPSAPQARAFKLRSPTMNPDFVYVVATSAAEAIADFERHNPHHKITHVDDSWDAGAEVTRGQVSSVIDAFPGKLHHEKIDSIMALFGRPS